MTNFIKPYELKDAELDAVNHGGGYRRDRYQPEYRRNPSVTARSSKIVNIGAAVAVLSGAAGVGLIDRL